MFYEDPGYFRELMELSLERVREYMRAVDAPGVDLLYIGGKCPAASSAVVTTRSTSSTSSDAISSGRGEWDPGRLPQLRPGHGPRRVLQAPGRGRSGAVQPAAKLGDAELDRVKAIVGTDSCVIIGGVDQVQVIQHGTADEVRRATAWAMETGKPGGKSILQNADFLEHRTPIENVRACVETAIEHAWY